MFRLLLPLLGIQDNNCAMTPLGSFNSVSHDLSDHATATFRNLSIQRGKVLADYIWIGSTGADLHSKTKVLESRPAKVEQLPTWHFDGTATSQQTGSTALSTVVLRPRAMYSDPLRGDSHLLVLCDTHTPSFNPAGGSLDYAAHSTNNRVWCESVMSESALHEAAFSVEQQYTLLDPATRWPLGAQTVHQVQSRVAAWQRRLMHSGLRRLAPKRNCGARPLEILRCRSRHGGWPRLCRGSHPVLSPRWLEGFR